MNYFQSSFNSQSITSILFYKRFEKNYPELRAGHKSIFKIIFCHFGRKFAINFLIFKILYTLRGENSISSEYLSYNSKILQWYIFDKLILYIRSTRLNLYFEKPKRFCHAKDRLNTVFFKDILGIWFLYRSTYEKRGISHSWIIVIIIILRAEIEKLAHSLNMR